MKKTLTMLLCAATLVAQAQTLKTYSGPMGIGGKCTFTYYEDPQTGNEVRQGAFRYTDTQSIDVSTTSFTYTGNYKNGFKNGVWNYVINYTDAVIDGRRYMTGATTMTLSFKDGIPDGPWKISCILKQRARLYSRGVWVWGPYEAVKPEIVSVNFRNGVLSGPLSIKTLGQDVTGQLNDKGQWTGHWVINKGPGVIEVDLVDGIVKKQILRSSGMITYNSNYDSDLLALHEQMRGLAGNDIQTFCTQHRLSADYIPGTKHYNLSDIFYNRQFLPNETGGDKTYTADNRGNYSDTKEYGGLWMVERVAIVPLDELGAYRAARTSEQLKEVLVQYGQKLSDADRKQVLTQIEEWEKAEQAGKNNRAAYDSLKIASPKLDEVRYVAADKILSSKEITVKSHDGAPDYAALWNLYLTPWLESEISRLIKSYGCTEHRPMPRQVSSYSLSDIQRMAYDPEQDYVTELQQVVDSTGIILQAVQPIIEQRAKFVEAINVIVEVDNLYDVKRLSTGSVFALKKGSLYDAYYKVLTDDMGKAKIDNILVLADRLKELVTQDTKALQKELKNAKDTDTRRNLLTGK